MGDLLRNLIFIVLSIVTVPLIVVGAVFEFSILAFKVGRGFVRKSVEGPPTDPE